MEREPHAFFHIPSPPERALTGVRQAMVPPLRGESGLIGSMMIANRMTEGTAFLDEDLRLLETLANQAAVALENGQLEQSLAELSRLKEQLRYQAYHDPLTGLANRSLLGERVEETAGDSRPVGERGRAIPRSRQFQGRQRQPWATPRATGCWSRWPTGCATAFATATS